MNKKKKILIKILIDFNIFQHFPLQNCSEYKSLPDTNKSTSSRMSDRRNSFDCIKYFSFFLSFHYPFSNLQINNFLYCNFLQQTNYCILFAGIIIEYLIIFLSESREGVGSWELDGRFDQKKITSEINIQSLI